MNCEKMTDIMPMLVSGTLPRADEKEALEHLMECGACRQELAFWTKVADAQEPYEKEFAEAERIKIYEELTRKDPTALDITKQAVKVYFKVIEKVFNI